MRKAAKTISLFCVGGAAYCAIELIWRGHTHWTMYLLGGLCFLLCGAVNEVFPWEMPLWQQQGICSVMITMLEFCTGYIVNIVLKLNVWDYSHIPCNIMGQICPQFMLVWFMLSIVAIVLDDYMRYWLFDEEYPRYTL